MVGRMSLKGAIGKATGDEKATNLRDEPFMTGGGAGEETKQPAGAN